MIRGRSLRKWAFAAIKTGLSVIPLANLAMVFPVHGNMSNASSNFLGPMGSA